MFVTLLSTVIILIICVVLMCIRIILKKNGRFPNTHIGGNKALRDKGIHCANTQDWEAAAKQTLSEQME